MQNILINATDAASYISSKLKNEPKLAIILGSGLGGLADEVITDRVEIPYSEIPHFPVSTVKGHSGKLIAGKIYDKDIIIMQGRFHYYEGYELSEVTFPIRVFALLGVRGIIVTNSAGGINRKFDPGDLMLITDHINISSISPLRGENEETFGERFPSMTEAYSLRLRKLALDVAFMKEKEYSYGEKIELKEGVYAFMRGPQYETPAEIRMLDIIGADAVGMSTVPEVIVANQMGMEVLGISCITNVHKPGEKPTHEEVIENADKSAEKFRKLIMRILKNIT